MSNQTLKVLSRECQKNIKEVLGKSGIGIKEVLRRCKGYVKKISKNVGGSVKAEEVSRICQGSVKEGPSFAGIV